VEVEPDFQRFQATVAKKMQEVFTPAGRKAGGDLGRNLARGIDASGAFKGLRRRFSKVGEEAGREIAARIGKGAKPAAGDMFGLADAVREVERRSRKASGAAKGLTSDTFGIAKAAREAGQGLRFSANQSGAWQRRADGASGTARNLAGRLRGLGSEFAGLSRGLRTSSGGFGGIEGIMARANRSFSFFRNLLRTIRLPVFVAGIGLGAQGLSAFAAGAIAAASAVGPLSGALIALPAAALGAAQAISVLKLATAGVGDAVKAALAIEVEGGTQAVDIMRQQEDAAERVADAKRNLTSVQRQATYAQEELTAAREDARRELDDMRLASERSHDSEQGAVLSLKQAKQDLAKALADPEASGLDIRFAEEAVDQARHDLEETRLDAQRAREDYRKAQKAGVEGMPQVVSAKRAEADANRAVTDAQRDLERAVRDSTAAMEEQGAAASAFNEKMSQLPPAAQRFVRVLIGMKPRLDALRATAAEGFFPGAEKGLRGLMGNFKEVRGVVDLTATSIGRIAAKAGKKLGSAVWGRDLSRIGKLNARILGRMGDAGLNLADAFRHLMVSAEPFLDWLSGSIADLSAWIEGEAAAGRETGRLAGFFDRTRETMERIGPILKGVGGAFLNIGDAARPLGNEILDSLGDAAEGWRRWTDSTAGQNRLKRYFTETKPAIFEMGRLIRDAGKAFFELGRQSGVADLLRLVRTELIPAMRDLVGATTGWAARFLEDFGQLRKEGVPAFDAFVQVLAEHAAEAGWRIAKGLTNAFLNAGIWGKLAITGWLLAKFGGARAFAVLGTRAGGALGRRFLQTVGPYFAADGLFGSVVGRRMGRMKGVFGKWGGKLGVALVAGLITFGLSDARTRTALIDFGRKVGGWVSQGLEDAINWAFDKVNYALDKANFAAALGVDAPELPEVELGLMREFDPFYGPGGIFDIPAPRTDKARKGFEDFRRKVGDEADRTRKAFRSHIDLLPGVAERSGNGVLRQMLPRLDSLTRGGERKARELKVKAGGHFKGLAEISIEAMESIGISVSNLLDALNLKKPKGFDVQKALREMPELQPLPGKQRGGSVRKALATGGLAATVPGNGTGDRHVLSLNGTPVAKVESREGIFVGNRNLMGALEQRNKEVPRFQKGGLVGQVQQLRRGGLVEPKILGPEGPLRNIGQEAVKQVYEGAKSVLAKAAPEGGGGSIGNAGPLSRFNRSYPEHMLSSVEGKARFSEALVARIARWAGLPGRLFGQVAHGESNFYPGVFGIDPGGTEGLGLWQITTGFNDARIRKYGGREQMFNPLKNAKAAKEIYDEQGLGAWYGLDFVTGLMKGGLLRGALGSRIQRLAGGGMVDPSWDPGGEVIASSIEDLVQEYMRRYDSDITQGYGGASSPSKSKGHILTGTATDIVPKSGNWEGAFAKGLEVATSHGFQVFYDGSHGTDAEYNHGPGNHAHINWVGYSENTTAADARQRLREFFNNTGGIAGRDGSAASGPQAPPRETVPPVYKGAKTGNLGFGPLPKSLKEVDKEIARWQKELPVYRKAKAHAMKNGKAAIAEAINANIQKIEQRLAGLRDVRSRLRLKEVRERLMKRINRAFGRFGNYDKIIEGSQRAYEVASQYAEQVVDLEPQSPELSADATDAQRQAAEKADVANFTNYVETQEHPAFGRVLERVADWRNNILRSEKFGFSDKQPSVLTSQNVWEKLVREARARIEKIGAFGEKVQGRVTDHKAKHKGQPLPKGLQEQVAEAARMRKELPALKLRDSQFSGAIQKARELFFADGKNRLTELPMGKRVQLPLPGSGSLEEKLTEVQGIHWPDLHNLMGATDLAPPRVAGRFGGVVWELQGTIEELGLKVRQAASGLGSGGSSTDSSSELISALEAIAERETKSRIITERLSNTMQGFDAFYGNLPKYHSGGVTPGPSSNEFPALLQGHETIRTAEQELALASAIRDVGETGTAPSVLVEVQVQGTIVSDRDDPVEVVLRDPRTKRVIQRTRGGRVTAGGARR
jgi:hypothetical protein